MFEKNYIGGKYKSPLGDDWKATIDSYVSQMGKPDGSPEDRLSMILNTYADRNRYMNIFEFDLFAKIFSAAWYKEFKRYQRIPTDIRPFTHSKAAVNTINNCLEEEGWLYQVTIKDSIVVMGKRKVLYTPDFNNCMYRLERI